MLILRMFYAAWALGALAFFFSAVSALVFGRSRYKRLRDLALTPLFCAIWPLAICSPDGRKRLISKINKL